LQRNFFYADAEEIPQPMERTAVIIFSAVLAQSCEYYGMLLQRILYLVKSDVLSYNY
jgi:hypothetical protein